VLKYLDGNYKGEEKNDKPHGKGRLEWSDGSYYEGEWKNGKRHGKGKFINFVTDPSEDENYDYLEYEGCWKNGKPNGKGIEILKKDNLLYQEYIGDFVNREKEGKGKIIYHNISSDEWFEGQFKDSNPNGYGKSGFSDGGEYKGHYKDGFVDGFGVLVEKNKSPKEKYTGEWKHGKKHGKGILTKLDGTSEIGEWFDGCKVDDLPFSKVKAYFVRKYPDKSGEF